MAVTRTESGLLTTKASALKLPKVPTTWAEHERDEDHTRRLIEQAFGQISLMLQQASGGDPKIGGSGAGGFFPKSGILGEVTVVGTASHYAYAQLLNPVASGILIKVYELYVSFPKISSTALGDGKRTSSPVTLTSPTLSNSIRLDEQDTNAIVGILQAAPHTVNIGEAAADFVATAVLEGQAGFKPYVVRAPGSEPIVIKAGSALEIADRTIGTGDAIRVWAVWDEVIP